MLNSSEISILRTEKPENPFPTKIKIKSLNPFKLLTKLRLLKLIKENNFNGSKNIDLGSNEDFLLPLNDNNVEDFIDFLAGQVISF